ncbi:lipoprotein [Capnocytophaga sp. oral taxon 338 str. F0234]|nr:lipoprotein [Capnocytophaga sp. oral taxon 338 str. F0234]
MIIIFYKKIFMNLFVFWHRNCYYTCTNKCIIKMKKILLASFALALASCGQKSSYEGTYEGTLPCADCSGINVTLTINKDSYTSQEVMEDLNTKDKGNVAYDTQSKVLTLTSTEEKDKEQRYKVKEDGSIALLDADGKEVEGELASYYILKKK